MRGNTIECPNCEEDSMILIPVTQGAGIGKGGKKVWKCTKCLYEHEA